MFCRENCSSVPVQGSYWNTKFSISQNLEVYDNTNQWKIYLNLLELRGFFFKVIFKASPLVLSSTQNLKLSLSCLLSLSKISQTILDVSDHFLPFISKESLQEQR